MLRGGGTERNVGAHCHRHRHRRSVSKERKREKGGLSRALSLPAPTFTIATERTTNAPFFFATSSLSPVEIYLREKERISSFALSFLFFSCSVNDGIKVKGDLILLIPFLPFHSRISPLPPSLPRCLTVIFEMCRPPNGMSRISYLCPSRYRSRPPSSRSVRPHRIFAFPPSRYC